VKVGQHHVAANS